MELDKNLEKKLEDIKSEENIKDSQRDLYRYNNIILLFESLFIGSLAYIIADILGFSGEKLITNIYAGVFLTIVCLSFIIYSQILKKLIRLVNDIK